ncbi:MAG: hypothetical protein P8L45_03405 [Longimicrobiales bacterium]|nr:hypothetical protein [Longimicrobiales bacterium]
MNRHNGLNTAIAFVAMIAASSATFGVEQLAAQSDEIEKALSAAPARARDATTVIRWHADQSYEVLREGEGPLVCYDRSTEARRAPFDIQCTSMGNLDRVAQSRQFRAEAADREAETVMIEAAEASDTRIPPEYGSVWFSLRGQDHARATLHMTVAVPYATSENSGFPANGRAGGLWIMDEGTSTAHLMVPGR